MDTISVALPEGLKEFVVAQVHAGGYETVNDYVSALIVADQKQKAKAVIEAELLKGIQSGFQPMTDVDWAELRNRARQPRTA